MSLFTDAEAIYYFNNDSKDATGKHDATVVGTTYSSTVKKLSSYSAFQNGIDDKITVPDDDALTFSSGFGIAQWIRPDSSIVSGNQKIISKHKAGNREFVTDFDLDAGSLRFFVYDQSANAFMGRLWTSENIHDDIFHLVIFNYDGGTTASSLEIKVDNVQVDDTTSSSGTFTAIENLGADIEMGWKTETAHWYKGYRGQTIILPRPFTGAEESYLWNGGAGRKIVSGFPFFFDPGHY